MFVKSVKDIADFFNVDESEVKELLSKYELDVTKDRYLSENLWIIFLAGLDSNGDLEEIKEKWETVRQKRYRTQVSYGLKEKIIKRDKNKCRYCGKKLNKNNRVVDHFIPWSKCGRNTEDNLVLACRTCNSEKGDKLIEETNMTLLPIPD